MRKITIQSLLFFTILFGGWLLLSQVKWCQILHISDNMKRLEKRLGDFYWDYFSSVNSEITDPVIYDAVDSLLLVICDANGIDREEIKLHILDVNDVNAFALPDHHIVIFKGLIQEASNEAELVGVICHELAHIECDHVMKHLIQEVGLSVLFSVATGSSQVGELAQMISSLAYSRKMEKEADLQAVDYMFAMNEDVNGLANFMYKLVRQQPDYYVHIEWISTHPESQKRADYLYEYSQQLGQKNPQNVLSEERWEELQFELQVLSTF